MALLKQPVSNHSGVVENSYHDRNIMALLKLKKTDKCGYYQIILVTMIEILWLY